MTPHAVILYIVLPSVSAGIAGYIWGGAILDLSKVKTYGGSLLRGLGVSAGAYAIFALLYACGLPLLEAGWSLRQAGSLLFFTLTFGLLLAGPMVSIAGMVAAVSLFRLGRHVFADGDGRVSETGIV